MTCAQHLNFYARARGVSEVDHNVEQVMTAVGLSAFRNRMAHKLSGGNKRKLSLGIALIGNPSVLLVDEGSSGMDAGAKRIMWRTLAAVSSGRSLVLTTHSLEEADALGDRVGIMARRMLAVGTSDSLRRKHGDAYYVHLVHKDAPHTSDAKLEEIKNWIGSNFTTAKIENRSFHGQIRFEVPNRIWRTRAVLLTTRKEPKLRSLRQVASVRCSRSWSRVRRSSVWSSTLSHRQLSIRCSSTLLESTMFKKRTTRRPEWQQELGGSPGNGFGGWHITPKTTVHMSC
jgi:ABC-type multidrug transport system ATPase subunit